MLGVLAASPVAARSAIDKAALDAAGIRPFGGMGSGLGIPPVGMETGAAASLGPPPWRRALSWFTQNQLPGWYLDRLREDAKSVYYLDPDLAANRSWSLAAKVQEQRHRNYIRLVEQTKQRVAWQDRIHDFAQRHGFYL